METPGASASLQCVSWQVLPFCRATCIRPTVLKTESKAFYNHKQFSRYGTLAALSFRMHRAVIKKIPFVRNFSRNKRQKSKFHQPVRSFRDTRQLDIIHYGADAACAAQQAASTFICIHSPFGGPCRRFSWKIQLQIATGHLAKRMMMVAADECSRASGRFATRMEQRAHIYCELQFARLQ